MPRQESIPKYLPEVTSTSLITQVLPMRVHYLQHVSFEGLGQIESILKKNGHRVTGTELYAGDPCPSIDSFDMLIVMGGPMSVHDEAEYPWLISEKKLILQAIQAGKKVLGVCLGAQLMAHVLGSKVYNNSQKEIGWFPIQRSLELSEQVFQFPSELEVFHWHGETFDLPQDAVRLAESAACKNQAFQYGRHAIGLQFHIETSAETAQIMVQNCGEELKLGPTIQSATTILAKNNSDLQQMHGVLAELLNYLMA